MLHAIGQWLTREGHFAEDNGAVIAGVARLLTEHGVPIDRITTHIKILHPLARSVWRIWRRDQPMEEFRPVHGRELSPEFLTSPVKIIFETGAWIERRLDRNDPDWNADGFGVLDDLRADGFTHYLIGPVTFSNGDHHGASFATKQPGGFSPEQLACLRELNRLWAPIMETKELRRGASTLLETYLGHDTLDLLRAGRLQRGDGRLRRAALWYSDLRGFTSLTEGQPLDEVVGILNAYFGLVGAAALRHGGEIVQFIGDAILIYFATTPAGGDADACQRALATAVEARAELALWNAARRATGRNPIEFGVGLDLGDIIHVNVGTATRQAFNIVGPAVNRAARIEELTKLLAKPLLVSADVAAALGLGDAEIDWHALRGVPQPVGIVEPGTRVLAPYHARWSAASGQ